MAGGRRAAGLALGWGCCLLLCCAAASKLEVSMPAEVEVEVGGTARIECNFYIPGNGSYTYINWFYVDRTNSPVRLCHVTDTEVLRDDTAYKERLSVGEDKALSISKVTTQDARTFVCQVGAGSSGVGENRTELHVYKVPETPEIEPNPAGISVQSSDNSLIARCESKNSFPPPNITWHKNGEQLQLQDSQVKYTRIRESSGLYTVTSTLFAPVTREDRDSRYHCTVHYWLRGQRHALESQKVQITVFYPAEHLTLQVVPSSALVKEGDNVKLVCESDGNPPPVFSFFKKELDDWQDLSWLADPNSGVLTLHGVNKSSSGVYKCQSLDLDDMKELEKIVELVVNYIEGVRVKMEPSSSLQEGDNVTLSCNAHSPVALNYQWIDKKGRMVAEGKQLTLKNLTFETSNNFSCKVVAPSVPGLEQSKQVSVAVQGKPRIVAISSSPLYVRQDEVVNLTCKAIAFPRPSVRWNVNGTAHEYVDNQHIASNLTVRVSHDLLRAGAKCRVSNELGVSEKHIQLLDQKTTAESQGVIIVAIIVAILVVAVLGAVIYFLHKKGKIPCGRAGKQDITRPEARKDKIVVEVKSDKLPEEAGLLQGANGQKRPGADQSEKYIDLRN
ncbi:cell surface glycoprotein MUC18 isoform X2 [Myiozetetes cayanensis]|uniref:cell surface glycoprotein MUC18 isoform X2 n=1 Tax=Myiozetetes cayanensis TaxID=478635 RepID=UPI00215EBED2|nr:cell surface glycoprotein MUC18 isoform X2 [Myiozetetes cayanensis]